METISKLTAERVGWLHREFALRGYGRPEGYFAGCLEAQERGELVLLVARDDEELLGFLKVAWESGYPHFRDAGIPEIQDLNVVLARRRQGVATRLMDRAEEIIRPRSAVAGIGVGLHPGYAAAQRMYVLRGYVPDGRPLTYDDEPVKEYQATVLDDSLTMHLIKELGAAARDSQPEIG